MNAPRDRAAWSERLGRPLSDPGPGTAARAVAHRSLAHLRGGPGHANELVSQLVMGEEALVLDEQGEWLMVETGDGYVAWLHRRSVVRTEPDDLDLFRARLVRRDPPAGSWVVVARGPVGRAGPEPDAPPLADLVQGAVVESAGPQGDALPIALPDGTRAYLDPADAVPVARLADSFPPTGHAALVHAERFLGLPYLWGGTSEKGFDCSGLVQRIFGLHGTWLPRDSDQQAAVGAAIDPDRTEVRDGDLAFFTDVPDGRATHVGILAADGRMLHASTTRHGVAWDALDPDAEGWSDHGRALVERLSGIRRVLPG